MNIAHRIQTFRTELPSHVQLVAVSKTKPENQILEAYTAGQRIFAENKVQELIDKYEHLPKDIEWHYIGHLQRNKVKFIIPFVRLIHGVDSLRLLEKIEEEAQKCNRTVDCLLQIHIAKEDTKFGLDTNELAQLLESEIFKNLKNTRITGLMGMATYTDVETQIHAEFAELASIFKDAKEKYFALNDMFCELSMGMSGDYRIAVQHGSTLVRIGSSLFGGR